MRLRWKACPVAGTTIHVVRVRLEAWKQYEGNRHIARWTVWHPANRRPKSWRH